MQFSFAHNNFNVRDLDRSLSFYREALGLTEVNRIHAEDSRGGGYCGKGTGSVVPEGDSRYCSVKKN